MTLAPGTQSRGRSPLVWYMTQGYAVQGGHEAHLLHYATEVRRHGFDTLIIVLNALPRTEHAFMALLRQRQIALESVNDRVAGRASLLQCLLVLPWMLWVKLRGGSAHPSRLRGYLTDRLGQRNLAACVRRDKPDIIHVLGRLSQYAWEVLPADRTIIHHGTSGHVDDTWDTAELVAFRDFAQRAARNFAPGRGVAENVRREFGVTRDIAPIFTICPDAAKDPGQQADNQNGIRNDQPRVSPQEARSPTTQQPGNATTDTPSPRFGTLCRFTQEKGIACLLDALRQYRDRHGAVDFLFAGKGALEIGIRDYILRHRLDGVRVLTRFESPCEALEQIDVFVHPSVSDAMPMAIAEALMCGLPCIVTRVGGIPDLVRDGQEGLLIDPADSEAIVSAMERFALMAEDEYRAFRKRARSRYEEVCRPESVAAIVAGHYEAIMKL